MSLLDRVKTRTGSDLPDSELQAMIDAITAELAARLGPAGAITIELGDAADPDSRFRKTLRVQRPIDAAQAIAVVEIDPGNSGALAERTLAAGDYRVMHGGRTLQRLTSGSNGNDYWAPLVRLTYTPIGNASVRDEATIKLILLDLSYRGLIKSEEAGDYKWSGSVAADSYSNERESIIAALAPASGGMVMA